MNKNVKQAKQVALEALRKTDALQQTLPSSESPQGFRFNLEGGNLVNQTEDKHLQGRIDADHFDWGIGLEHHAESIVINGIEIRPTIQVNTKFGEDFSAKTGLEAVSKHFKAEAAASADNKGNAYFSITGSFSF